MSHVCVICILLACSLRHIWYENITLESTTLMQICHYKVVLLSQRAYLHTQDRNMHPPTITISPCDSSSRQFWVSLRTPPPSGIHPCCIDTMWATWPDLQGALIKAGDRLFAVSFVNTGGQTSSRSEDQCQMESWAVISRGINHWRLLVLNTSHFLTESQFKLLLKFITQILRRAAS